MNSLSSRENTSLPRYLAGCSGETLPLPICSWPGNTILLLQLSCIPEMPQEIARCELVKLNSE